MSSVVAEKIEDKLDQQAAWLSRDAEDTRVKSVLLSWAAGEIRQLRSNFTSHLPSTDSYGRCAHCQAYGVLEAPQSHFSSCVWRQAKEQD